MDTIDPRDDDAAIRDLVHRWALAVHAGDLDGVLADHTEDVVMFDVPPPEDGVRGLDAYRATWPAFFERSEEHTSELQSRQYLVCRLLLEKKKKYHHNC